MAYSILDIWNLALGHIGQGKIDSLTEDSVASIQCSIAWPFARGEALESSDWTFAKVRVALAKNSAAPAQGFLYAYTLPPDFLTLCRQRANDPRVSPGIVNTTSSVSGDLIIENQKFNYVIEAIPDGTLCLLINYDNSNVALVIQYIRNEQSAARYSAHFCLTASYKLAALVAKVLTGSNRVRDDMDRNYGRQLTKAKGHNSTGDYLEDETGNNDWRDGGRF